LLAQVVVDHAGVVVVVQVVSELAHRYQFRLAIHTQLQLAQVAQVEQQVVTMLAQKVTIQFLAL